MRRDDAGARGDAAFVQDFGGLVGWWAHAGVARHTARRTVQGDRKGAPVVHDTVAARRCGAVCAAWARALVEHLAAQEQWRLGKGEKEEKEKGKDGGAKLQNG